MAAAGPEPTRGIPAAPTNRSDADPPKLRPHQFAGGRHSIRVRQSAAHDFAHIDKATAAFTKIGKKYDILHKTKQEIIAKYGE